MNRVMLVDDEAAITTQLEARLSLVGYDVVGCFSSGEEAIEMARKMSPDLILMDIVLPGKYDGIDASAIIRKEQDIPIVFITAYDDEAFVERAKHVGPFGYILKPFVVSEIRAAIEIALHRKSTDDQLNHAVRELQDSLEEKETLIKEINHRVKNNFQILHTLMEFQLRNSEDDAHLAFIKVCQNRVRSMTMIQDLLSHSDNFRFVNMMNYSTSLVSEIVNSFPSRADLVGVRVDVEDLLFPIKKSFPVGLIINELVTNSLKHAFPAARVGEVHVALNRDAGGTAILSVSDNGIGMPDGFNREAAGTLGLELVYLLGKQLGADISMESNSGTRFLLRFPGE
jgi:two-component sensor histidine kinase